MQHSILIMGSMKPTTAATPRRKYLTISPHEEKGGRLLHRSEIVPTFAVSSTYSTGDEVANITAGGIFYASACHNSSVPCGALMRPLPVESRWKTTGSGTISVSVPGERINIINNI